MRLADTIAQRRAQLEAQRTSSPFAADEAAGRVPDRDARFRFLRETASGTVDDKVTSLLTFAQWYLPEFFTSPFGEFHREIAALAMQGDRTLSLIAAPPEHGKTAVFLAHKLWCAVTGARRMYAQIAETRETAETNLKLVEIELELNSRILADFGDLMSSEYGGVEFFAVRNAVDLLSPADRDSPRALTAFRAFGARMSLKAWTFQSRRVDFAELDDYEPLSSPPPKKLTDARERWMFSQVVSRLDRKGTGVWLHNASSLGTLADRLHTEHAEDSGRDGVECRKWKAVDGSRLLWPERYDAAEIDAMRRRVGPTTWSGDYQQNPLAVGARFQPEWIGTYTTLPPDLVVAGRLDPSLSAKGDTKALAMVGFSPSTMRFYVLPGTFCRQATLDRMVTAAYDGYELYRGRGLRSIQIEADFRQDLLYGESFAKEAKRRGYRLPLGTYQSRERGAKSDRIVWMEPSFEAGLVLFPENYAADKDIAELVHQLMGFDGSGRGHDDGPDALSQALYDLEPIARKARLDMGDEGGGVLGSLARLLRIRANAPDSL